MIIEGKEYISSRRAAEIGKYSNDYIGQLCRGGKIQARMIGRSWHVDSRSFESYMNTIREVKKHPPMHKKIIVSEMRVLQAPTKIIEQTQAPRYPQGAWIVSYEQSSEIPLQPQAISAIRYASISPLSARSRKIQTPNKSVAMLVSVAFFLAAAFASFSVYAIRSPLQAETILTTISKVFAADVDATANAWRHITSAAFEKTPNVTVVPVSTFEPYVSQQEEGVASFARQDSEMTDSE
jgi:hypothetical protein